jgi:hypothetical protein
VNNYDQIIVEFSNLIQEGRSVLASCRWHDGEWGSRFPGDDEYFRIRTRASNLIRRICGEGSPHYREIETISKESIKLPGVIGILEASKADFEGGLLFNLKSLVEAEILGDFLEQANALLSAGYHVAAASLAGAVLEDTLRKICDRVKITYSASTKIGNLNADLTKAGVYNLLTQKQITALADIRNNADHGHFDKFKPTDVEEMTKWIGRFASEHLG